MLAIVVVVVAVARSGTAATKCLKATTIISGFDVNPHQASS